MVLAAGAKLLAKEPSLTADFSKASAALSKARLNNVPRYLPNPEENWGPKTRHGRPLLGTSKVSSLSACETVLALDGNTRYGRHRMGGICRQHYLSRHSVAQTVGRMKTSAAKC